MREKYRMPFLKNRFSADDALCYNYAVMLRAGAQKE